eukprot:scaffold88991_cov33-Phaeocystis_antarctica.AAC.1
MASSKVAAARRTRCGGTMRSQKPARVAQLWLVTQKARNRRFQLGAASAHPWWNPSSSRIAW